MWPELHFTSSAKLRNLRRFWSCCSHNVARSSGVVDFLQTEPCNRQPRLDSRFELRGLNSHVTLAARGQPSSDAAASVTKTTPRNSSDPTLSAGQVRFPKQALKGTRDWEHTTITPLQSPSIIILHTNRAFRWTKSQSIGSTWGVWSVSGEGKRSSQPNRGKL